MKRKTNSLVPVIICQRACTTKKKCRIYASYMKTAEKKVQTLPVRAKTARERKYNKTRCAVQRSTLVYAQNKQAIHSYNSCMQIPCSIL